MRKITGIDDDFYIKVIDAAGNSDWINPIITPVESHSGLTIFGLKWHMKALQRRIQ